VKTLNNLTNLFIGQINQQFICKCYLLINTVNNKIFVKI